MKATGIIRRIDDLGRVVIPREIRRTLRLREGDPLELFTTKDGVLFQKYKISGQIADSGSLLRALQQTLKAPVLLCNRDSIIDASGIAKTKFESLILTDAVISIMEDRKLYAHGDEMPPILIFNEDSMAAEMIMPVVSNGDVIGALIIPQTEDSLHWDNASLSLKLAAKYLKLYLGEYA